MRLCCCEAHRMIACSRLLYFFLRQREMLHQARGVAWVHGAGCRRDKNEHDETHTKQRTSVPLDPGSRPFFHCDAGGFDGCYAVPISARTAVWIDRSTPTRLSFIHLTKAWRIPSIQRDALDLPIWRSPHVSCRERVTFCSWGDARSTTSRRMSLSCGFSYMRLLCVARPNAGYLVSLPCVHRYIEVSPRKATTHPRREA